jgi:hypothetical protein
MKAFIELEKHIESMNILREIFKEDLIPTTGKISAEHALAIERDIECKLSPENLHQDGEASRVQVESKKAYFELCKKQLRELS